MRENKEKWSKVTTKKVRWRIIPYTVNSAAKNMASDEAIAKAIAEGSSPPTMRLYGWEKHSVSIANAQSFNIIRNPEGIEVVRRPTGGNAVIHHEQDVTYSVIAPRGMLPQTPRGVYEVLLRDWIIPVIDVFRSGREPIRLTGKNDVTFKGKKVCGNAQHYYTTKRVLLQQGAIFFARSQDLWKAYLNVPSGKLEQLTNLQTEFGDGISRDDLLGRLLNGFSLQPLIVDGYEVYEGGLTAYEDMLVRKLEKKKFERGTEWTLGDGHEKIGTACAIDVEDD